MDVVLLGARFLLVAVFATAALAKLVDRNGVRRAVEGFGVPTGAAGFVAAVLAPAELAVAGALAFDPAARAGAGAAGMLLTLFAAAIAVNLVRGRTPECRCFGQVHAAPVSWRAVSRNVALTALAIAVALAPTVGVGPRLDVTLGAAVAVGAALVVWRRRGPSGLPVVGSTAPEFRLPSATDAHDVTLADLRERGLPVLLVFADAACGPCIDLAPDIVRWQEREADRLTVAVLEHVHTRRPSHPDEHGREDVLVVEGEELWRRYGVDGTPSALLVDSEGRVASAMVAGGHQIAHLVETATEQRQPEPHPVEREPLGRREFLLRGARASVGLAAALALPARAFAQQREPAGATACPPRRRCGKKCCAAGQTCIRKAFARRKCICDDFFFRDVCPGGCKNTAVDSENCGKCGVVCGPGEVCVGGACVPQNATACAGGCPPSGADPLDGRSWCCAGQCKDLTSDLDNCGRCGARCATGKRPTCCEGYCRDTASDPRHCGGCFKPCRTEGICHAGKCLDECPAPLRQCGKTCYRPQTELCCNGKVVAKDDLQHDRDHCSPRRDRCGTRCPPGQICEGGRCVTPCPAGQTRCGGRCADTTSDPANCGADCAVCNTTLAPACCGGTCTNLGLNDEHCGACFNKCKPGEFCRFGECVCPLGMTCG